MIKYLMLSILIIIINYTFCLDDFHIENKYYIDKKYEQKTNMFISIYNYFTNYNSYKQKHKYFNKKKKLKSTNYLNKIKLLQNKINNLDYKLKLIINNMNEGNTFNNLKILKINDNIKLVNSITNKIIYKVDEILYNIPEYIYTSTCETMITPTGINIPTPNEVKQILYETSPRFHNYDFECNRYVEVYNKKIKIKQISSIIFSKNYIIIIYKAQDKITKNHGDRYERVDQYVWSAIYSDILHMSNDNQLIIPKLTEYGLKIPYIGGKYTNSNYQWPRLESTHYQMLFDFRLNEYPIHIVTDFSDGISSCGPYRRLKRYDYEFCPY